MTLRPYPIRTLGLQNQGYAHFFYMADPFARLPIRENCSVTHHGGQKKSHKRENGLLIFLGVVVALVTLVTLGNLALDAWKDKSTASSESTAAVTTTPPSESSTTAVTTTPPGYISEATWTDGQWPFTVPDGVLMCSGGAIKQITFTANDVVYALNAAAVLLGRFADPRPIVLDNSAIPGTKVDVRPVIRRGVALCGR